MDWEDCLHCLGERFTRQRWSDRFGMDARTFVRWVRAGRRWLGLTIRYETESPEFGKTTQVLVLDRADTRLINEWGAALSASFVVRERRAKKRKERVA